jgi:hypothetical protein
VHLVHKPSQIGPLGRVCWLKVEHQVSKRAMKTKTDFTLTSPRAKARSCTCFFLFRPLSPAPPLPQLEKAPAGRRELPVLRDIVGFGLRPDMLSARTKNSQPAAPGYRKLCFMLGRTSSPARARSCTCFLFHGLSPAPPFI